MVRFQFEETYRVTISLTWLFFDDLSRLCEQLQCKTLTIQ